MKINLVYAWVKENDIAGFSAACRENARLSRQEPLVVRFDVIQEEADPSRFVLIEVFRDERGPQAHKETDHYKKWRAAVEGMMRESRRSTKCVDVDFRA